MNLKLGKHPAVKDERDFKFSSFVDFAVIPKTPKTFGHERYISFPMCGNGPDESVAPGFEGAGDCVFAGACHETEIWLKESGAVTNVAPMFSGKTAIHDYSAVTGYVVGNDASDQGTNVRDALKYRSTTGILDVHGAHHKIAGYLALDPGNVDHLYAAMYLFGVVGIGIDFPQSAMDQFNAGKTWTYVASSPSDGGHYIPLVAKRNVLKCVTWGKVQGMTLGFYQHKCDEAYVILSKESINSATKKSPEGIDIAGLTKLLPAVAA